MTAVLERRLPAMLGHELRNPLAGALTNVAVAAELTDPEDPRANMLRLAQQDLMRMAKLIDRCLEFADLGRIAPQRQDLVQAVRGVAERRGDAVVTVVAPDHAIPVGLDRVLFERALENLIENALGAGAGAVSITVEGGPAVAAITVADDGPGVASALRERIFEPFVSGRGSRGLGLPFTREVITAHGGTVVLGAAGPGATFRIELPA